MVDVADIWDDDEDNAQFAPKARPQPPDQPVVKSDFDRWFYAQKDLTVKLAGKPLPMATTLLYRVCAGDTTSFNLACSLLEQAFNAGKASREPRN